MMSVSLQLAMENNDKIIELINKITQGYKGPDDIIVKLKWLGSLIDSYQRYLPARVTEKIKIDPTAKKVEGERRIVTVAFADLSGFTALSETMDAEDIANIINEFFTRMVKIVYKYGGSVDKFLGDALMVLFGAPIAHHDDTERAIRAALDMMAEMKKFNEEKNLSSPLSMSIGINSGPAVALNVGSEERMEYTVIGDTVNLAARLEGVSKAGEIIISHETYQRIADVVDVEKMPSVKVKGKRKPVLNYLVKDIREHYQLPDTTRLQIVGRETEKHAINQTIESAKSGKPALMGISGDPGMGKTRLALEASSLAQNNGFIIMTVRCMPYEVNSAYAGLVNILAGYLKMKKEAAEDEKKLLISLKLKTLGLSVEEYLPYIGVLMGLSFSEIENIPPDELQKRIFYTIREVITHESKKNPVFIRIEDLQWCDPTTTAFFDFLFDGIQDLPIFALCEYRSDFAFPWIKSIFCKNIVLERLALSDIEEFCKKVLVVEQITPDIVNKIYAKSEGNPLFTQEIIKYLLRKGGIRRVKGSAIPTNRFNDIDIAESISGIILDQIDRMNESDRRLLQYASVIGPEFRSEILSRLFTIPETDLKSDLERLVHFEGILTLQTQDGQSIYEFISPTTYEVIYGSLLKGRRREIHGQIGSIIESDNQNRLPDHYEVLAHHFSRSEDKVKGVFYSKSAGFKSYRMYALKESLFFYDQALVLLGKKDLTQEQIQDQLYVFRGKGMVLRLLGNLTQALSMQKKSLKLAHQIGVGKDEAGACLNIGIIFQEMGIPQKGLNYWTRARRIALKIDEKMILGLAVNNLGNYYLQTGDTDKAINFFNEALKIGEEIGDKKAIGLSQLNLGSISERTGDFPTSIKYYDQAYKNFNKIGDKENLARTLNMIGLANIAIGNAEVATKKLYEALVMAQEIGDKLTQLHALGNLGLVYAQNWQLDKAREKLSECLVLAQSINELQQVVVAHVNIGDTYLFQGQTIKAMEHHVLATEIARQIKDYYNEALAYRSLAWIHLYQGSFSKALEDFNKSRKIFIDIKDGRNAALCDLGLATLQIKLGGYDPVAAMLDDLESRARQIQDPEILALTLEAKGEGLMAKKDYTSARSIFERLPDLCQSSGNKRLYAWTIARMARLSIIEGKNAEAKVQIDRSIEIADEIGDKILMIYNLMTNGIQAINQNELDSARNSFEQAMVTAKDNGMKEYQALSHAGVAKLGKINNHTVEEIRNRSEVERIIEQMTVGLPEEIKNNYKQIFLNSLG